MIPYFPPLTNVPRRRRRRRRPLTQISKRLATGGLGSLSFLLNSAHGVTTPFLLLILLLFRTLVTCARKHY